MALKLSTQNTLVLNGFTMTVADSVDGLAYVADASGNLTVAPDGTKAVFYLTKRAKVGDKVAVIAIGEVIAKASGAIAVGGPCTPDANGKMKAATIGTDQVVGWARQATTNDGDIFTMVKVA